MPFTFSHPAIILPLAKLNSKRISATGLVIGSMAPDFEFFIRMRLQKIHGHTPEGIFYWDLPLTIVLAFLYHLFVRDALIRHSPEPIRSNFEHFIGMDWLNWFRKYWYVFIYSALIGIGSHLFWDGFTHESGFFGYQFPFLLQESEVFIWTMPNYMIAQLGSSLIGGLLILMVLIFPKSNTYARIEWKNMLSYWLIVGAVMLLVMLFRNMQSIGDVIATSISGGLIGLLIAPFLMNKFREREKRKIFNKE